MWVSPFRYLRINGYLLLPAAFRSLSRLSSALSAKASTLRSLCLTFIIRGTVEDGGFLMTVNNSVSGLGFITAFRSPANDMACYLPCYHLQMPLTHHQRVTECIALHSFHCFWFLDVLIFEISFSRFSVQFSRYIFEISLFPISQWA